MNDPETVPMFRHAKQPAKSAVLACRRFFGPASADEFTPQESFA